MKRFVGYHCIGRHDSFCRLCFTRALKGAPGDKVTGQGEVMSADSNWYGFVLQAFINVKALAEVKVVHNHIIKTGFELDVFLQNNLVNFYAKCGDFVDARQVFDKMSNRNVISWNALIAGYVQHEQGEEALKLFCQMHREGMGRNEFTFGSILRACASLTAIKQGKCVHADIIKIGFETDVVVGSALVDMYTKSWSLAKARQVFDKMPERNAVSWTAMIVGYTLGGYGKEALQLYRKMSGEGMSPTYTTFASVLSACAGLNDLTQGEQVHCCIVRTGFEWDVSVGNGIVTMYAKCGSIDKARKVFDEMHVHDVVSWNAIIAGYAQNGHGDEALALFRQSQQVGVKCNQFALGSVLSACGSLAALEQGKQCHAYVTETGFDINVFVGSALIDMYAKCGSIKHARIVFDKIAERNVVSWNAMIAGYGQHGLSREALQLFEQMQQADMKANNVTFASVLGACIGPESLQQGRQLHAQVIKTTFMSDVPVGNALVTMYAKCGTMEDACKRFGEMVERDLVTWNAMVAGYSQIGYGEVALKLFYKMQGIGMRSDQFTFTSVLRTCASLADLERGKQVHVQIIKTGYASDLSVGNAFITMYAKCGTIYDALKVFDRLTYRDTVSWNAMIAGYAQHGLCSEALYLFEQMQHAGIKPNQITFVAVLSACSHVGLVDEGRHYFVSMSLDHHIVPSAEHYACMVDLLGRAGHLDEAENFMNEMPFGPSALVCRTLLGACRVHGNVKIAKCAAECLFELDPKDAATYVTLSNIYAAAGRWDDAIEVRKMMKDRGVKKEPGFSWIEVKNRVHAFVVGDQTHPQTEEIYSKLEKLTVQMEEAGYLPDTNFPECGQGIAGSLAFILLLEISNYTVGVESYPVDRKLSSDEWAVVYELRSKAKLHWQWQRHNHLEIRRKWQLWWACENVVYAGAAERGALHCARYGPPRHSCRLFLFMPLSLLHGCINQKNLIGGRGESGFQALLMWPKPSLSSYEMMLMVCGHENKPN
eukprot:Gb_34736 [translate_table: standard]